MSKRSHRPEDTRNPERPLHPAELNLRCVDLTTLSHLPRLNTRGQLTAKQLDSLLRTHPDAASAATSDVDEAPVTSAALASAIRSHIVSTASIKQSSSTDPSSADPIDGDVDIDGHITNRHIDEIDESTPFLTYVLSLSKGTTSRRAAGAAWTLTGTWSAAIALCCARCAQDFLFRLPKQSFELELIADTAGVLSEPASKTMDQTQHAQTRHAQPDELDTELDADAIDQILVDPHAVDLADILIDSVLLETPMVPKCQAKTCKIVQMADTAPATIPDWKQALAALKN